MVLELLLYRMIVHMTFYISLNVLCIILYFRAAVCSYGPWHQIRVDHGRELYLVLYIQEHLRHQDGSSTIVSYVQSTSAEVSPTGCARVSVYAHVHTLMIAISYRT